MIQRSITRVLGMLLGLSGLLLIVWWLLLGLSQLSGGSGGSFASMVLTPAWLPVNILGLVATLLLAVGLCAFLTRASPDIGVLGFVGTVVSIAGVVLFDALQFDETFVWPVLAQHAPLLMEPDGPIFRNPAFFAVYIAMGVLFAVGFVLLAAHSIRRATLPLVLNVLLLVGALLFAGGALVPIVVRTVGVLMFGSALIWAGISLGVTSPSKEVT